ncbi:MAG: hypothetical protein U5L45_11770 [Saprospiraceae bacterium]|nr:hypothetical protein [Saprospiraceae bacterium]
MKNLWVILLFTLFNNCLLAHRTEVDIMDTEAGKVVALAKIGGEFGK